jgi:hypothetical protein
MASTVPASFRDKTLARLAKSQLSASRQQLIFNYKLAFEAMGSVATTNPSDNGVQVPGNQYCCSSPDTPGFAARPA